MVKAVFHALLLVVATGSCALADASGAGAQRQSAFELEIAGFRFREAEITLQAGPPDRVIFHVLDPAASSAPAGAIRTTINGEPAGTIQTVTRTPAGRSVICDLRRWPRFALRAGRNDLLIRVDGRPLEASFAVFLPGVAPAAATRVSLPLVAHETRRIPRAADTEPPTLQVARPPQRIDVPFDQPVPVVIRGTANDNRGVATVLIDGVPSTLTRLADERAGALEFRQDIVVAPGATQVAVEAHDRAGNVSRALLRIVRLPEPARPSP